MKRITVPIPGLERFPYLPILLFVTGVEATVNLVKGIGGKAFGYKCDLSNNEDVYKVAKQTQTEVGDVSICKVNYFLVKSRNKSLWVSYETLKEWAKARLRENNYCDDNWAN